MMMHVNINIIIVVECIILLCLVHYLCCVSIVSIVVFCMVIRKWYERSDGVYVALYHLLSYSKE